MSHISRLRTRMVDKKFLLLALNDLGYRVEEGEFHLRGMNTGDTVQIKIHIPFSYDVGVQFNNNAYEIVADWWGVRKKDQQQLTTTLLQRYAYHAALDKLQEQGFTLAEETKEQGQIHLVLRRIV